MKKTSNRLRSLGAVLAVLALLLALAVPAFAVEGGFADLYYRIHHKADRPDDSERWPNSTSGVSVKITG